MKAWMRHHGQSLAQTLRGFASSPVASVLNVLVIGLALALPLGAWALLQNLQGLLRSLTPEGQVSVFLDPKSSPETIAQARKRLGAVEGVITVVFVSKDQALAHLRQAAGIGELVSALRRNPLPDALVLTLASNDPALSDRVSAAARALPAVTYVQADSAWASRLDSLLALGRTGTALLATVLSLALVTVTFNTIRLQIVTRREEIELSKLIGATDDYVRRPFYYLGVIQGLSGGMVALAIVGAGLALLDRDVAVIASHYGGTVRLGFPPWADCIAILAFAAALGWTGAYASVSIHLRSIGRD